MGNCKECYKLLYEESEKSFEKRLAKILVIQYVLIGIVAVCLAAMIALSVKAMNSLQNVKVVYVEQPTTVENEKGQLTDW